MKLNESSTGYECTFQLIRVSLSGQSPPPKTPLSATKHLNQPGSYHIFPKCWLPMCTTALQQLTGSQPSGLQSRPLADETWFASVSIAGKGCGGDALLVPCFRSSPTAGFLPPRIHADAANHEMTQAEVTCHKSMVWHFQWIVSDGSWGHAAQSTSGSTKWRGSHHRDHTGRQRRRQATESRRKEINSVALEGCLLQPQLQPLQSVLPSVPAAPARGTLPLENPTLGWRKLPQFCTKIPPRQKTPSSSHRCVFLPQNQLLLCLRLRFHGARPQQRRQQRHPCKGSRPCSAQNLG